MAEDGCGGTHAFCELFPDEVNKFEQIVKLESAKALGELSAGIGDRHPATRIVIELIKFISLTCRSSPGLQ